jgi:hypothetical protein
MFGPTTAMICLTAIAVFTYGWLSGSVLCGTTPYDCVRVGFPESLGGSSGF